MLAAWPSYPSCCGRAWYAVRVEVRTAAPGSRCSSRQCHTEDEEDSRGDAEGRYKGRRIAARRPLGRRHDGVGAVGGLTADPDTTGSSGQLETLAEGRGGRATGHCSARRYRGRGGELRRSRCAMVLKAGGVSQTLVYEGCLIERRHMFVAVSYLVICP